ncbi:MAG TPA: hypothetical protein VL523_06110 [Terriglobia bacterium]|nr:hypothetical protein [Terriglobia bacterium]
MSYTASDLRAVGAGFVLFGLFAFAPGYTFGWLSNALQFRERRLITRLTASVPLSVGLAPVLTYYLWRWWLPLVWIACAVWGAACVTLLIRDFRANRLQLSRAGRSVLAIAAGWLALATLTLVDLQIGNRLYFNFVSYDYSTRAAFIAALSRGGMPPHNPYFFAGQPAPLRYHYFWLIPCSLVDQLGGTLVSARQSLMAGTLWSGLGLLAIVALYLRFFQSKGGNRIERRTLIAVALLGITGLDILPVLLIDYSSRIVLPCIEYWNNQIDAWITTALWEPHHLAALVAGLTGFLLTWDAARQPKPRLAIAGVIGGGLALASSVGVSIYVGGTLAAGCAAWLLIVVLKRSWRQAVVFCASGIIAAALALPFLAQVAQGTGPSEASAATSLLKLAVRSFTLVDNVVHPSSAAGTAALNLAFLPLNYFLEFGFFFVVACLAVRRFRRRGFEGPADGCAAALAATSLLLCTFLSSTVISSNDLGWRSALLLQFILLLWAAEMWDDGVLGLAAPRAGRSAASARAAPRLVAVALVLGALGSCYEVCMERAFPILADSFAVQRYSILALDRQLGRRTFELRRAYELLARTLPANATVQHNPEEGIGNIPAGLYSDRQMVADIGNCGTVFGGSEKFCDEVILPRLKRLFDGRQPVTAAEVASTCRDFSISALVFKDTDPVWANKSSWIWKAQPLLSNDFVRVIRCGGN